MSCPASVASRARLRSRLALASCPLWHFWHHAARFMRLDASGRSSKTCAVVSTTVDPVIGCGFPFSAPQPTTIGPILTRSHRFRARTNRTNRLRTAQSLGYRARFSGRIGTTLARHSARPRQCRLARRRYHPRSGSSSPSPCQRRPSRRHHPSLAPSSPPESEARRRRPADPT